VLGYLSAVALCGIIEWAAAFRFLPRDFFADFRYWHRKGTYGWDLSPLIFIDFGQDGISPCFVPFSGDIDKHTEWEHRPVCPEAPLAFFLSLYYPQKNIVS
jgi:hypothetical protein